MVTGIAFLAFDQKHSTSLRGDVFDGYTVECGAEDANQACGDVDNPGKECCDDGNRRSGDGCSGSCIKDDDVTGTQVAADTSKGSQQALGIPVGTKKTSSVLSDIQVATNGIQRSNNVAGGQFDGYPTRDAVHATVFNE